MMLRNQTKLTEFILLGFGEFYGLQKLLFVTFLMIYTVTMTGNIIILVLIVFDCHLHTPLYFFLGNLSFLEVCYSSNIFPRLLSSLLTEDRRISFSGCLTQWFFFGSLEVTESSLLCAMSYDRYLAICKPLHYATIMNTWTCVQLAAVSWINGFIVFLILLPLMLQLRFCGPNEIDHYVCDCFPILKLSCSDTSLLEMTTVMVAATFTLPPFLLTLTSYMYIIAAVLQIPSTTGRQKAFSTCSSHLIVVSMFYGFLMIVYMLPKNSLNRDMEKTFSLFYTALPPLVNPFIYSLRNKEVKDVLRNNIGRLVLCKTSPIKLLNLSNA